MDKDAFPLVVGKFQFVAYYQQGFLNKYKAEWKRDARGPHHLVVCSCGQGLYANSLDEAVHGLRGSFRFAETEEHYHDAAITFPCNVIAAGEGSGEKPAQETVIVLVSGTASGTN